MYYFIYYEKNIGIYEKYLRTTQDEQRDPFIRASTHWDVICDKGYIGKIPQNLEPFKRITPKCRNMRAFSETRNKEIAKARVWVEMFFGRNERSWKILTDYRLDEKNFDYDVDNCFLLTNEELLAGNIVLTEEDAIWYRKYLKKLELKTDEVTQKKLV